ncbi:hypothetical protein KAI54_03905 [Candidatus Gracilibacteria bacterium]|nr:hypothetical protein [Candidatus Gracilibacteria bacterium]
MEDISVFLFKKTGFANFAKNYVESIKNKIEILSFFPEIGYRVEDKELSSKNLRCLPLGEYVIFHIWHSKKSSPNFQGMNF